MKEDEVKYGRFFGLIKRMYPTSPDNSNTLLYQNIIQSCYHESRWDGPIDISK
jgi:hypothetical protein